MEKFYVIDIEGDGLTPTKFHVLSYKLLGEQEPHSTADYDEMRQVLEDADAVIGHNFSRWDTQQIKRILGVSLDDVLIIDTLALSWYLYPTRRKHGLEGWGDDLGIAKPHIDDWYNDDYSVYAHRCERDVLITERLFLKQEGLLKKLYRDDEKIRDLYRYFAFKMKAARLAEEARWKVDLPKVDENIKKLSLIRDQQYDILFEALPRVPGYDNKDKPKRMKKNDGSLTTFGERWYALCKDQGKDPETTETIKVLSSWSDPNPNSHDQLKAWLFSLGWDPCTFKTNDKGKDVPQISDVMDKTRLTPSVKRLEDRTPAIGALEGYFLLNHRISVLEGFKKNVDDKGYVAAEIQGFTNTLRFKHSVVVNLPGVDSPYGREIREVLVAPEGFELCGSDMKGLEDRTKQHYIYEFDPKYVEEMNTEDFDPHLDLAELSGMMTHEEVTAYKAGDHSKKGVRHKAKTTNYTCTYGAFPPKIAKTAGMSLQEAEQLHSTYWKRNWAIKKVAEIQDVKKVEGQKWLRNPVNGFWYSLRAEKDRFSTLNQGTGSYCFDVWISFILQKRPQITAQFHDEGVFTIRKGFRSEMTELLQSSIEDANEFLGLDRRLDISIDFGDRYSEIH